MVLGAAAGAPGAVGESEAGRGRKGAIRILGISCSPRRGKTTAQAVRISLEAAEAAEPLVETELIDLGGMRISGWIGGANGAGWQNTYIPAGKYADILQPASKYVFVEEADPRGWNRDSWVLNPQGQSWVDPLAIWHSRNRSTLAYADGHVEMHHWVDSSTVEMSRKQEFLYPVPPDEGEDLKYMVAAFPQKMVELPQASRAGRLPY